MRSGSFSTIGTAFPRVPRNDPAVEFKLHEEGHGNSKQLVLSLSSRNAEQPIINGKRMTKMMFTYCIRMFKVA